MQCSYSAPAEWTKELFTSSSQLFRPEGKSGLFLKTELQDRLYTMLFTSDRIHIHNQQPRTTR